MEPAIKKLLPENLRMASLHDRVYLISQAIYDLMPEKFHLLEGFTREEGGVVFFSRDNRKIYNSGIDLHALPIGKSGWFVNPAISMKEAPVFFERISRTIKLPLSSKLYILSLIRSYESKKTA